MMMMMVMVKWVVTSTSAITTLACVAIVAMCRVTIMSGVSNAKRCGCTADTTSTTAKQLEVERERDG